MNDLTHIYGTFEKDPGRQRYVMNGIAETVAGSFLGDNGPKTRSEVSRRTNICAKWFLVLYKDLKWASVRCLDELPKALRCDLDKIDYKPTREGRDSWGADNARDLVYLPA